MIKKINATKELIYSILLSIVLWLILGSFDAFEKLIDFLETHDKYELDEFVLLLIIMGIVAMVYSIRRAMESNKINSQLATLNLDLAHKIAEEIEKRQEQESILMHQSKLSSMGEMIGNIAHQWRQPLNTLGLVMQNIQFAYEIGELDSDFLNNSIKKVNLLTSNMSNTIDDFRDFFMPNKNKENFVLETYIKKTIALVETTFEHNSIEIELLLEHETIVHGFPNEYSQSILNIINNAKDAIISNKIENGKVQIEVTNDNNFGIVTIKDNAGGIPAKIIDKIYEPYFSTKEDGKGTGIGLYMTKTMIEKNMEGLLEVNNLENGASFTISIPLPKD